MYVWDFSEWRAPWSNGGETLSFCTLVIVYQQRSLVIIYLQSFLVVPNSSWVERNLSNLVHEAFWFDSVAISIMNIVNWDKASSFVDTTNRLLQDKGLFLQWGTRAHEEDLVVDHARKIWALNSLRKNSRNGTGWLHASISIIHARTTRLSWVS